MICEPGEVVVVPFPFTDRPIRKRRPALVLSLGSFNSANGHTVLAMITSAAHSEWLGDVPIADTGSAGLPKRCVVRWKVMTLPNGIIERRLGTLSAHDRRAVAAALRAETMGESPLAN